MEHDQSTQGSNRDRPSNWTEVYTDTDKETGMTVIVSRAVHGKPIYSMRLGTKKGSDFTIHVPLFIESSEPGKFSMKYAMSESVQRLVQQAEEWVLTNRALVFNEFIDRKTERETRQAGQNHPGLHKVRSVGKTEKKRQKEQARKTAAAK